MFNLGDKIRYPLEFTIVEKIAEGGMGEVYEAIIHGPEGFEKRAALKFVRSGLIRSDESEMTSEERTVLQSEFLLRLVNEAKLVSNLIHTHIVQIYFLGTLERTGDFPEGFIAMEYVNGVNLRSFLDRHLFDNIFVPLDLGIYIASRVARALEYAHTRRDKENQPLGIVHRDVSPTNILLSTEGVVKLSDFGIARALFFRTTPHEYMVGKRRYMAPEQHDNVEVDFRADIFSLGLVLYEILTNRLPVREDGKTVPPSHFRKETPPEVDRIVLRAIATEKDQRYGDTGAFASDLEHAIYDKGYGPTFVTLAKYLHKVFPQIEDEAPRVGGEEKTVVFRTDGTRFLDT
ncbi:MAG: serine/threonine protein kinase [Candidatus Hydrogenedentota bacterium]|nr:MAG: serine/threonine protein kinase [Candidatus Hydrogenedentota bacterium]